MNKRIQILKYVIADLFTAASAWVTFYIFRKVYIEALKYGQDLPLQFDNRFFLGLFLIPIFWIMLYATAGAYRNVLRKSRLGELGQTLFISLVGVIIIFFVAILDDTVNSYRTYYQSFLALFCIHFTYTAAVRFVLSSLIAKKVHKRIIGFNTLLVGSNANALAIFNEMESQTLSSGNRFVGFVHIENKNGKTHLLAEKIPHLGEFRDIHRIIKDHEIEEIIIAIESSEHDFIRNIINNIQEDKLIIKIIPDIYDILSGSVKMSSIFSAPLIEISRNIMPLWQQIIKRIFDIVVSILVIILFSPFYLITAIIVKLGSPGPAIYKQERIGQHGKPFHLFKFRSMALDAEKNGPALSSKNDARITPFGSFMRKVRLDEMPNFINVLIGDMSIVGPRPERQYYIDKILEIAPHYKHLHKVKPGITSWGQVKYGYAENVPEMVERLKYDLLYIENMSLAVDFKILIYTVLIVMQGRGK